MSELRVGKSIDEAAIFFDDPAVVERYSRARGYRRGEAYVYNRFLRDGGAARLLELGCLAGRVSFLLAPRFGQVHAFDVAPAMVDAARRRLTVEPAPIQFELGDATAIPSADAWYDSVILPYNRIESIPTQALRVKALREVHRVLKPGGRFVFSTKSIFTPHYWLWYAAKPRVKRVLRGLGIPLSCDGVAPLGEILYTEDGRTIRLHTTNPFSMKRLLREVGFRTLYFNAEGLISRGLTRSSLLSNFGPWDQFYACEKPLETRIAH